MPDTASGCRGKILRGECADDDMNRTVGVYHRCAEVCAPKIDRKD